MENDRDCPHCKHYVLTNIKGLEARACEKWDCEYEPEEQEEEDDSKRSS
jgi:hypothetical protein